MILKQSFFLINSDALADLSFRAGLYSGANISGRSQF
jgi:hypothetical protein